MAEILEKLRPDRDLQCYFERPSAIAAISEASATGFTVSGCWRQQFDWAVIEWNRDNVFEHPFFRNLPDGDLSGLQLTYDETRQNCIPLDSTLFPTVDWPFLRVWAEENGIEKLYKVPLAPHATAVEGSLTSATAVFELQGTPTAGDYIELAWLSEHHTYQLYGTDTLETAAQAIVDSVNAFSTVMTASRDGSRITLSYVAAAGANGNRVGVYANVCGGQTEKWEPQWQQLTSGTSPTKWRISLDFGSLEDPSQGRVPTNSVRKLRWTYAADLQPGEFLRSEFQVEISNWSVSGTNRSYMVAGRHSRRIEDDSSAVQYTGTWTASRGNFSGGSLHYTVSGGASLSCTYQVPQNHRLYLGTRRAPNCTQITVNIDGIPVVPSRNLALEGEDVLIRLPLGDFGGGVPHSVIVTHNGPDGTYLYFDFLEAAVPSTDLPIFSGDTSTTLATDWDTDHSIAIAPERTAWLIQTLGFTGRTNHYVGALWFYELHCPANRHASGTVAFAGTPVFGSRSQIDVGGTVIEHVTLIGDTPTSIAKAFEFQINNGSTGIWAEANGAVLTIHARAMGSAGNQVTISADSGSTGLEAQVSGPTLAGGTDGPWLTDLQATPRLNRAVRDWTRSFAGALKGYGIDVTTAFSMELQHGDDSEEAGIAQRYPNGDPVWVNTPALQTNFSPASIEYWKQVYLDIADVLAEAGQQPFLQFGEVQWWYFPSPESGMPFYDQYTTTTFEATYGRAMTTFTDGQVSPDIYPEESAFLPQLIGNFTNAIIDFVRQTHASTRFEVLYPPDVNEAPLNKVVNLPASEWSPSRLDSFKTENFTYTGARDLNKAMVSIQVARSLGFPANQCAHLVGIGDYTTPWRKERRISQRLGVESVVLFALDQFCLIGYDVLLSAGLRRSLYMG